MERTPIQQLTQVRHTLDALFIARGYASIPVPDFKRSGHARYDFVHAAINSTTICVAIFCDFSAKCFSKSGTTAHLNRSEPTSPSIVSISHTIERISTIFEQQVAEKHTLHVFLLCSHQYVNNMVSSFIHNHIEVNLNALDKIRCELWHSSHLLYNPSTHTLVSSHEIVPMTNRSRIFKSLSISDAKQLKKLQVRDIMCKWIGAREHDIVQVTHHSPYFGEQIDYFLVIKSR